MSISGATEIKLLNGSVTYPHAVGWRVVRVAVFDERRTAWSALAGVSREMLEVRASGRRRLYGLPRWLIHSSAEYNDPTSGRCFGMASNGANFALDIL